MGPPLLACLAPAQVTVLNHNCVQIVGEVEAEARPHTDSRKSCRFAAVLYLSPKVPPAYGTSFFRQRMPNGSLGGNMVPPPHDDPQAALGARFLPPGSFVEDSASTIVSIAWSSTAPT